MDPSDAPLRRLLAVLEVEYPDGRPVFPDDDSYLDRLARAVEAEACRRFASLAPKSRPPMAA